MNFNEIFRSFFGFRAPPNGNDQEEGDRVFPGGNPPWGFIGPGFYNHDDDDDKDNDDESDMDLFGRRGGFGFGWGGHSDPFADLERQTQDMFRHFEEMFKNFGLSDFHSEPPSIETTPNRRRLSPRDEMLKQPDELKEATPGREQPLGPRQEKDNPVMFGDVFRSPWQWNIPALPSASQQGDKDLDEQVKDGKLDEILKPKQEQRQPSIFSKSFSMPGVFHKSFSKSISIQTFRKPDGTIETRRTERDSDGNVTTTATTSEGDKQNPVLIKPAQPSQIWPNQPSTVWPKQQPPYGDQDGNAQKPTLFDKFFGSWNR